MPTPVTANALRLAAALALAILGGLAHRYAGHASFTTATVPILTGALASSGGRVSVPLPDLSALRDWPVVVRGRLHNPSDDAIAVDIRLDGYQQAEAEVSAGADDTFVFVLRGGTAQAVTGGGDHHVEMVGPDSRWEITTLDAANAWIHIAARPRAAIVPREVQPDSVPGPVTAGLLFALVVAGATMGLTFGTRRSQRVHSVLTAGPVLVLVAAIALPLATRWRLVLDPLLIWALVLFTFAPSLLALMRPLWRGATRLWRRDPLTSERGAILVGLCALVVALPIFEVVRGSPEFFVARNTSWATALGAAAILLAGLPLALLAVERALRWVSPAAASGYFLLLVGLLVAALVHPWLTRAEVAGPWTMAAFAATAGLVVAAGVWRSPGLRGVLAILAPAALVVPVLFFGRTDVRESLAGWTTPVRPSTPARTPPVVFVVFDEFPLHSLLDERGEIDSVRYPHMAALAGEGTWYREATTVSSQTVWAVPAIASGRYPEAVGAVPTLRYYPGNLFTLLAGRYRMTVFGRFLQLCPEGACERDLAGPADGPVALAADLGVVWLHIVAPAFLAESLPPVVGDWRGFAAAGRYRSIDGRTVRNDRLSEFERFIGVMTAEPARLYFLHSLTPHMPFEYVPSGRRYAAPDYQGRRERNAGLFERVEAAYADALHQRHLLQVGFVDTMIGRITTRLRELGIYDDALVIVTADHGASYRERMPRRAARRQNLADILRVPLIIKFPQQASGGAVDGVVESVDILPTVADVLGARLTFEVDGRSLVGTTRPPDRRVFIDRSFTRVRRRDVTGVMETSRASLDRRIARFGTGDVRALYAVPGTADLLEREVKDFPVGDSGVRATLEDRVGFQAVDSSSERLPLHVRGRFFDRSTPTLAVAVNGRLAATTVPFEERQATWYSTMIPESALTSGRNDVRLFIVERQPLRLREVALQ